jgi:HAE1 family hydrophobic/amphiphilic exporter-1
MFISDIAIKRPVLTIVSMLALSVFGIVALFQLNTDEFPRSTRRSSSSRSRTRGASPDVVEREVIEPIEEVISGISGIDRMTSNSLDSFGNIIVEFEFEKDPQQAMQDVRDEISSIRNDLPRRWRSRSSRGSIRTTSRLCR